MLVLAAELCTSVCSTGVSEMTRTAVVLPTAKGPTKATWRAKVVPMTGFMDSSGSKYWVGFPYGTATRRGAS